MKDGKYIAYESVNGKESKLGEFEIKDNSISFPSEADKLNIDMIAEGPLTKYMEMRLQHMLKGLGGMRIEKESSRESVKKFGENNSV